MASINYWVYDDVAKAITLTDNGARDFVKAELGIAAQQNYNAAALDVLQDPKTQIAAYNTALDVIIKTAGIAFKKDVKELMDLGLPEESAKKTALTKANAVISGERAILDYKYPLINNMDVMASAQAKAGLSFHVPQPFGGNQNKHEKYKAAYKAQKANKGKK